MHATDFLQDVEQEYPADIPKPHPVSRPGSALRTIPNILESSPSSQQSFKISIPFLSFSVHLCWMLTGNVFVNFSSFSAAKFLILTASLGQALWLVPQLGMVLGLKF